MIQLYQVDLFGKKNKRGERPTKLIQEFDNDWYDRIHKVQEILNENKRYLYFMCGDNVDIVPSTSTLKI